MSLLTGKKLNDFVLVLLKKKRDANVIDMLVLTVNVIVLMSPGKH